MSQRGENWPIDIPTGGKNGLPITPSAHAPMLVPDLMLSLPLPLSLSTYLTVYQPFLCLHSPVPLLLVSLCLPPLSLSPPLLSVWLFQGLWLTILSLILCCDPMALTIPITPCLGSHPSITTPWACTTRKVWLRSLSLPPSPVFKPGGGDRARTVSL